MFTSRKQKLAALELAAQRAQAEAVAVATREAQLSEINNRIYLAQLEAQARFDRKGLPRLGKVN